MNIAKRLLFISALVFVFSCEKDDNMAYISGTNSVVNYLENNGEYSLFLEAIEKSDLYSFLNGNAGTYTVLAPDNEAFQAYLSAEGWSNIDAIPADKLAQLVDYHLMDLLKKKEDLLTGYSPTLATIAINDSVDANLSLFIKSDLGEPEFNAVAQIEQADIDVDNGVIHLINAVLAPPTLKTFMLADENLNAYYQKITASGVTTDFDAILSDPSHKSTVLVPNEFAVESFFDGEGGSLSQAELNRIYDYQLLDAMQLVQNFRTGYLSTKATEDYTGQDHPLSLYVNTDAGLFFNQGTNIVISDLITVNGNIQVIDSVLGLPTLSDFLLADRKVEEFKNALVLDGQTAQQYLNRLEADAQSSEAPFTVFAPENNAMENFVSDVFEEGEGGIEDIDDALMTQTLNLHFVKNLSLRQSDFSNQALPTFGSNIEMDAADLQLIDPTQTESSIMPQDIQATNGVMHYVDRVLRDVE